MVPPGRGYRELSAHAWVARRRQKNSRRTRQSPQFFNGRHDRATQKAPTGAAAFEQLWARGVDTNLVIVGKQGLKVEALVKRLRTHLELGKRLFWLEGISDEY